MSMVSGAGAALVAGHGLTKTYRRDAEAVHALRDVGLSLHPGELVALVGPSGSGKSTLLNVLCGWERADSGELRWGGGLAGRRADHFTWAQLALIPQALGLLEDLTLVENVSLPGRLSGRPDRGAGPAAERMNSVGISHLAERYPKQVSLGEQQRCCVSRALLLHPRIVLADEPTAHQDAHWTEVIFAAFRDLVRAGSVCLIATHNPQTWGYADRILSMHDGELREGAPAPVH